MREPEITTVTLQRVRWPLTETDLKELIIAALGDRVGAAAAEEVARSDGAFHWCVEDGLVIGAEIDLTVESALAPPAEFTLTDLASPDGPALFRRACAEAPEAVVAQEVLADAEVREEAPQVTIDPQLRALILGSKIPTGWSREEDLEMFEQALAGMNTNDVAEYLGRAASFIQGRFNLLTGKRSGGPIFPREVVRDALALICGEMG